MGKPYTKDTIGFEFDLVSKQLPGILKYFEEFKTQGIAASRTFAFWVEYIDMVHLLLDFMESERDSIWKTHLETFRCMPPYHFAFDHFKYFMWGCVYSCDMQQLPNKFPDVYANFENGKHGVSRATAPSYFNSVATDMALEQSFNKDSKGKGGIVGIAQDESAVEKWTITSHIKAAVVGNLHRIAKTGGTAINRNIRQSTINSSMQDVEKVFIGINDGPF